MEDKINNTIKSYCNEVNDKNDCINEISNQYINNKSFYNNIEKIYILSDIHGDLEKYLSFLSKINIIKSSYNYNETFDIYKELNNYFTYNNKEYYLNKDIYDIIKEILNKLQIELNDEGLQYKNTLIIQMGDIFDTHLNCHQAEISSFINNDLCIYFISLFLLYEYNNKTYKNNSYYIQLLGNHDFIMYNQIFTSVYNAIKLNQEVLTEYYGFNVSPIYFTCENINDYDKKIFEDKGIYLLLIGILNADELTNKEHFKDIFNKKIQYKKIIFDNIIHFQLKTKSNNSLTFHSIILVNNNCILSHAFFDNFFKDLDKFNNNLSHIQKVKIIDAIFQYINKKKDVNILFNTKFFNLLDDSLNFRIKYNKKNIIIPNKINNLLVKDLDFDLSKINNHYIIGHQPNNEIQLLKQNNYIIWFSDHKISKSFYTDYNYKYKKKVYIKLEFNDEKLFNYEFGNI